MSSEAGGYSVGMVFKMPWSSCIRDSVCWSSALICLSEASCKLAWPLGRVDDATARALLSDDFVMVWIAFGVGGAKPPIIPV